MQGFNWNHQRFDKWVKQLSVFRCTPIQIFSEYQNGKEKLWMLKMENYKISQKQLCVCLCGKTIWENPLHVRATALWKWKTQLDDLINMHTRDTYHWQMKRDGGEQKRGKTLFSGNAKIWLGITLTVGVVTTEWYGSHGMVFHRMPKCGST